jgi:hypothetical protein
MATKLKILLVKSKLTQKFPCSYVPYLYASSNNRIKLQSFKPVTCATRKANVVLLSNTPNCIRKHTYIVASALRTHICAPEGPTPCPIWIFNILSTLDGPDCGAVSVELLSRSNPSRTYPSSSQTCKDLRQAYITNIAPYRYTSVRIYICKYIKCIYPYVTVWGVGIAQSVQRRATGWKAGARSPAGARDYSLLCCVQTGSGALSNGYRWLFPWG